METFVDYLIEKKKPKAVAGAKFRDPKFGRFSDEEAVSIMFNFTKEKYGTEKITDEQLKNEVEAAKYNKKHPLYVGNQTEERQAAFVGGQWTEISQESYYDRLMDSTEAIVDMSETPEFHKYFDKNSPWSLQVQGRATHDRGVTGLYGKSPATSKTDLAMVNGETGETGAKLTAKQLSGAFLASSAPDDFGGIYSSVFHRWTREGKISSRMNQKHQAEVQQVKKNLRRGQRQAAQDTIDSWFDRYGEALNYAAGQEAGTGLTKFQRRPGESVAAVPDWGIYLGKPRRKGDTERYQRIVPSEHIKGQHPNVTLGKHPNAYARAVAKAKETGKPLKAKPDPAVVRMETEAPPTKAEWQARKGKAEREPTKSTRRAQPEEHPLQQTNTASGSDRPFHGDHELAPIKARAALPQKKLANVVSRTAARVVSDVKGKVAAAFQKKTTKPQAQATRQKIPWEKIEPEYQKGKLSVDDIGAKYGINPASIGWHASTYGWRRGAQA